MRIYNYEIQDKNGKETNPTKEEMVRIIDHLLHENEQYKLALEYASGYYDDEWVGTNHFAEICKTYGNSVNWFLDQAKKQLGGEKSDDE